MSLRPRAGSILNRGLPSPSESPISLHNRSPNPHGLSFGSSDTLGKRSPSNSSNSSKRGWAKRRRRISLAVWKRLSTRKKIILGGALVTAVALAVGLSVGLMQSNKAESTVAQKTTVWKPAIENTWQIQLNGPLTSMTAAAHNYDIDLFGNNQSTIRTLHSMNAKVICYFSAGTYEDWRPDAKAFANDSVGASLAAWAGENWLDVRSKSVRDVMAARIKTAADKGCDGVDPDNVDGYSYNNTGFPLTKQDAVNYMEFLAREARSNGLAIGLKNGAAIAAAVMHLMDWDINESCAVYNECDTYQPFIKAGRPVFHIEYVDGEVPVNLTTACNAPGTRGFSTILKHQSLDDWFLACPLTIS
ncbi:MAG: hypothetical protein LQ347_002020 [Umbilicaria vellea]|nr:MAG: hypothetical protein LQ347_002020 [Umbilicaria vellea]